MSRSTQFIGLTDRAKEYVAGMESLPSDMETEGFPGDIVKLGKWKLPEGSRDGCLREVVQEVPWSSGPMIFTCLAEEYDHVDNGLDEDGNPRWSTMCEWIHDPIVRDQEFCPERGALWA